MGRQRHPSNQAFGKWLVENGFDDIKTNTRADAMWWASHSGVLRPADNELTHPTQIRKWFNDQPKEPLPADLEAIVVETKTTVELDQRSAEKAAKVINRSKVDDDEGQMASSDNACNTAPGERSDAMWMASAVFQPLENDLTHPTRVRQWFNDQPTHQPCELACLL